ncbi:glycolipid transfer protein [Dactylonectria macrodidyma]|uniref:Glycolipid transfer protein n=1 Tax=Dactylonectria macrodidyma TaxID=307937 RepID=A0A9P9EGD8_9HYPO|nr:glycolipid transfer protein [Dactylonectria macrodidyma]
MSASISTPLDNLGKSLVLLDASVSPDGQISSSEFLAAIDSLHAVFDAVGSDALEGGRNDSAENVLKIRNLGLSLPDHSQYLQALIRAERATGKHEATEALLWLTRGLEFYIASVKRFTSNESENLPDSIMNAYKNTLKKHHGFVAKMAIKVAVSKTCPTRDEVFAKLGQDTSTVTSALRASATTFERVLGVLAPFLRRDDIKF